MSGTGSRPLVVYFSRQGTNYRYGDARDLEVGSTQLLAEAIAARTGAELFKLEAAESYSRDCDATVERSALERAGEAAAPEIAGALPDLAFRSRIFMGSPVWDDHLPTIVRVFLAEADGLAGKTIHPFVTYGIGPGLVFDDYRELCPEAVVTDGLALPSGEAGAATAAVEGWIARLDRTQ